MSKRKEDNPVKAKKQGDLPILSEKLAAENGTKKYQSESHGYDNARQKRPVQSRYSK